jgi:CDP-diacylglycerol---serine O-phosphatidyltransferase
MTEPNSKQEIFEASRASRIYLLPNLMTAGNLFCGFVAVIKCIQAQMAGMLGDESLSSLYYTHAVGFILAAVIFDSLDGRLARLGGRESLFGKEFDSIADIISFGMAPALMVFFLILSPTDQYPFFQRIGWFIGFIYLLCAAVRLSRFNVITHPAVFHRETSNATKDFIGLPVPAAAGTIASLVFFLNSHELQWLSIVLPVLMILIAYLMVSSIHYPSFKEIDWNTRARFRTFILIFAAGGALFLWREVGLVTIFLAYIFYGIYSHWRRRSVRLERIRQWREKRKAARNGGELPVSNPVEKKE